MLRGTSGSTAGSWPASTSWSRSVVALAMGAATAAAGLCLGVLIEHATHGSSMRRVAAANSTASYGLLIAASAVLRERPLRAAADAAVFFSAFVVGYYLTVEHEQGGAAVDRHYAAMWLLLAATACPLLAAALTWARRRPGVLRATVFAVPAAAAGTEALSSRTWGMAGALDPVVVALDVLLVGVYLLVLPRGRSTRAAAALWAVPLTAGLVVVTGHLADTGAYDRWMY